jgi:predicted ester cyclase
VTSVPGGSAAVADAFLAALGRRDWDRVEALCAPGYVHHAPGVAAAGARTYIEAAKRMFTAFPDMTATIQELVEGGPRVMVRYVTRGTHQAPFTGRVVSFAVRGLLHVRECKSAPAAHRRLLRRDTLLIPELTDIARHRRGDTAGGLLLLSLDSGHPALRRIGRLVLTKLR